MKVLLWLLLFLLLPFIVTVRAEEWIDITVQPCKCVCDRDVPDTLWYVSIITIDTIVLDLFPFYTFRDDCDFSLALPGDYRACCRVDTTRDWQPVVLQPCPRDIIPAIGVPILDPTFIDERKIIEDWVKWLQRECVLVCVEDTAKDEGWQVLISWQEKLDRYFRDKEK